MTVVVLSTLAVGVAGSAQEAPGKWILGTWEGAHSGGSVSSDAAKFEFKEEGGVIKWKMERKSIIVGLSLWYEASGTVAKIDGSSVELTGQYDATNADRRSTRVTGSVLKYFLEGGGDALQGNGLGAGGNFFPVTLKKAK